ncbi:MAG: hypothetical protein AB1782_20855 [Cyanobacteriota bacterium]
MTGSTQINIPLVHQVLHSSNNYTSKTEKGDLIEENYFFQLANKCDKGFDNLTSFADEIPVIDELFEVAGFIATLGLKIDGLIGIATGSVIDFAGSLVGGIIEFIGDNLIESIGDGINWVGESISKIHDWVAEKLEKIPLLGDLIGGAIRLTGNIAERIINIPGNLIKGIGNGIETIGKKLGGGIKKVGQFIKKL